MDVAVAVFLGRRYRLWLSRLVDGRVKSGCFAQDAAGRWFLNLQVEVEERTDCGAGEVGIDLGLATLSIGEKIENPRHLRRHEAALARAQRAGRKKRARAIHTKIKNARRHHLHQVTTRLVRRQRERGQAGPDEDGEVRPGCRLVDAPPAAPLQGDGARG